MDSTKRFRCHSRENGALLHGWLKTPSVSFPRRRESREILKISKII
ncbi:hypothetical protein [Rickettsia endosymbiont of Orchestes rusci]